MVRENSLAPLRSSSLYWTSPPPQSFPLSKYRDICLGLSNGKGRLHTLSCLGIFLDFPFSYKHDEWISASLFMLSCVAGTQMARCNSSSSRKVLTSTFILHFCYSSMFDHSLNEETPTTWDLRAHRDGIDSNCMSLSVLVDFTGMCRSRDVPKYLCVLRMVMGKGKEYYRNTERQGDWGFLTFSPLAI